MDKFARRIVSHGAQIEVGSVLDKPDILLKHSEV